MKVYLPIGKSKSGIPSIYYFKSEGLALKFSKSEMFQPSWTLYDIIEVPDDWKPEFGFDDSDWE